MRSDYRTDKDRFLTVLKINLPVFIAELAIGIYSESLTMISDSVHLSIHIIAPLIAYVSELQISNLPQEKIKQWTAKFNTFLFIILAGLISHEAWQRLFNTPDLKLTPIFFVIAFIGLAANIYTTKILYKQPGQEEYSINREALFWHMALDAIGSIILILGTIVIYYTEINLIDPILSFVLAGIIVIGAIKMFRKLSSHSCTH